MLRSRLITRGVSSSSKLPVRSKKTHPVRNFLLKATLSTALFYAGGLTLAVYNPKANEIFTENIPYGEDVVDMYESCRAGLWPFSFPVLREKIQETYEYIRNPSTRARESRFLEKTGSLGSSVAEVAPKVQLPVLKSLELPELQLSDANIAVRDLVDSVNKSIREINQRGVKTSEAGVEVIRASYAFLSERIRALSTSLEQSISNELSTRTAKKEGELEEKHKNELQSRVLELEERYYKEFENFKRQLEETTSRQLQADLKAHEQALLARHRNEVAQLSIKQVEEFNKIIESKLDKEREGRLSKLQELDSAVESLVPVLGSLKEHAVKSECLTQLTTTIQNLQSKLALNPGGPIDLTPEVQKLKFLADMLPSDSKCCSLGPTLIEVIVSELEEKTKSKVASTEQLYNRWLLLQPDLKTTSLLPPNAGFLGHLTAKLFSILLFTKEGVSLNDDMDSTVARVTENLRVNKLDKALSDVVEMRGWSRKSADDWVSLARRRLEVLALVDALDAEIKTN